MPAFLGSVYGFCCWDVSVGVRTEWLLGIAHQFSEAILIETLIIDKGARHQCVGNMLLVYLLVRPKGLLLSAR